MSVVLHSRVSTAAVALMAAALVAGCSDSATSPTPSTPTASSQAAAAAAAFSGSSTRQRITLSAPANAAFPGARGQATFKSGSERELQIEVENVRPGVRVVFLLGTQRLGAATVNSLRAARLALRGTAAPASVTGKQVQVKTSAGVLVVRGRF